MYILPLASNRNLETGSGASLQKPHSVFYHNPILELHKPELAISREIHSFCAEITKPNTTTGVGV